MITRLNPSILRRYGVSTSAVLTYIWFGRQKVAGHVDLDPYAKYQKEYNRTQAMERDARAIADWYNQNRTQWTDEQIIHAYEMIVSIQYGPSVWLEDYLRTELMPYEFEAAKSWAAREHEAPGSVDTEGSEASLHLRDRLLSIFWEKFDMSNENEPINMIREFLTMAFYGPRRPGERLQTLHKLRDFIDL